MADRPQATNIKEVFTEMPNRFNAGAAKGMKSVYQFDLTGDNGGKYNLAIDDGKLNVAEGSHASPNITITMSANDYLDMVNGKLNPQMAFMSGKLKIAGDMGLAMKMQQLFPMS
jgi:putative sterol carrier protein